MTIAAKHLDPLVGLDIHIILIPSPAGPIPTPLPHPYIGMVLDPMDYVPFLGAAVYINGLPRGQAGTAGIALPPHIPMGGPFAKPPTNESEIFMGSMVVCTEDEPQSFLGCMVLSCQDIGMPPPPRVKRKSMPKSMMLPTTVVLSIPMGMLVLIGGPPTISLMGMAFAGALKGLALLKKLGPIAKLIKKGSNKLHDLAEKLLKKLGLGDALRNKVHKGICAVTGHPVDIATGKVFTDAYDFSLPGPIPFQWERTWFSTSAYWGPLGHGWHHSYDQKLYLDDEVILYQTGDGRHIPFPPLKPGTQYYDRSEKLTFVRDDAGYAVRNRQGWSHRFVTVRGRSASERVLGGIQDNVGNVMQFRYDDHGRLVQIVDCGGRTVEMSYDEFGRVTALIAPDPTHAGQRVYVARYTYDRAGDLVQFNDALGKSYQFTYDNHLLVRETNRNGLSFYFQYDGNNETARCVRTWGDGGIYDHKLTYDVERSVTVVEDSLGHKTTYEHHAGVVTKSTDPLGNVRVTEYSEFNEVVCLVDPLGQKEARSYDDRGNLVEVLDKDGSKLSLVYVWDQLVEATDEVGGTIRLSYDDHGRLVAREDPTGARIEYRYDARQLIGVVDTNGQLTSWEYDAQVNLVALRTLEGWNVRWSYDSWGRSITLIDPRGNVERRVFDVGNRVVGVQKADGSSRELTYDDEGNLIHGRDADEEVSFTYVGLNRVASRSQSGATVHFAYDTEMRVVQVVNEHGSAYRFLLGPTGEVVEEHSFDGLTRRYRHDALGRVTRIDRPDQRFTEYQFDAMGRVARIAYSDGEWLQFGYRADGELVSASNPAQQVKFEVDPLGRTLRETQGKHWVASKYDLAGNRVNLSSSLGLDQTCEYDSQDEVTHVREAGGFEVSYRRDVVGAELERSLPGGLKVRSVHDSIGRQTLQEVSVAGEVRRALSYTWEPNDRLRMVVDALHGPTRYAYDAQNRLTWAGYSDGSEMLRMPDALGNLFRAQHRNDRVYGASGQLLESRNERGDVTRYRYDAEGNRVEKVEPGNRVWRYEWSHSGRLARVVRPDATQIDFEYDALGRRVRKTYRGQTTHWVWDGSLPLHEWVEGALDILPAEILSTKADEPGVIAQREAVLSELLARGPPQRGTLEAPITWLFDPTTFAPMAKLVGGEQLSIVTDHLGTPIAAYDSGGNERWSVAQDCYGKTRHEAGQAHAVPFRWPGQYEDAETGLFYNRFRYYDPESGAYISQDPIDLEGGNALYAYAQAPFAETDVLGLVTRRLAAAMKQAGNPVQPGHSAHHVVQRNNQWADRSEGVLQRNNPAWTRDSATNGASLIGTQDSQLKRAGFVDAAGNADRAAARSTGKYHSGSHIHGDDAQKRIFRILKKAERRGLNPEAVLDDIRARQQAGTWC